MPSIFILFILVMMVSCRAHTPAFDFGTYSEAEHHYEKGEYGKAIQKFNEYLNEPRGGDMVVIAHYYTAKSYEGLGKLEEARPIYEKIIQDDPKTVWADFARMRLQELSSEKASS